MLLTSPKVFQELPPDPVIILVQKQKPHRKTILRGKRNEGRLEMDDNDSEFPGRENCSKVSVGKRKWQERAQDPFGRGTETYPALFRLENDRGCILPPCCWSELYTHTWLLRDVSAAALWPRLWVQYPQITPVTTSIK